jgi:SAM-dependent methyltransferase
MTAFEWLYRCARPFDHPLYQHVFRLLSDFQRGAGRLHVLDVGGRRSNYTIGFKGDVCISDIPRESVLQHKLDLGATDEIRSSVLARRSNVEDYVFDDMTQSGLPKESFDIVVAVEVLEHVEGDDAFVRNVLSVLRPGGCFVMTTPNGDFLPVPYPDHKRHYRRDQLERLLSAHFPEVEVRYAVNGGWLLRFGVRRPSIRAPFRTLAGMAALFLCDRFESVGIGGKGPQGKRHLVAVARKP